MNLVKFFSRIIEVTRYSGRIVIKSKIIMA